ncbi:MAG TPA: chromate resistance protein ChrB domain-containing protein [Burkholderiales bacterium]|nr:chromate resistance protein ChrB domain-containing protein [Burkholderiales bacterium]
MSDFLALVLSLPMGNSTLRMRLWRALKQAGCGVLRDGVYLLPASPANDEALARLEAEIAAAGGFAMRVELRPKTERQLGQMRALFDRSAEHGALVRGIEAARRSLDRVGPRRSQTAIRRLERAFDRVRGIDFFAGEAQAQAAAALADLKQRYRQAYAGSEPRPARRKLQSRSAERYRARVWTTRAKPWVDRLASAWLIKRFIDREARFAWFERPSQRPRGAIGFDFDGAQFTHVRNRVTFETLLESFALEEDPALAAIGAAVHYLDVGGIPVADAKGLETLLRGAKEKAKSDDALLAEAMRVLDLLYSAYRGGDAAQVAAGPVRRAAPR